MQQKSPEQVPRETAQLHLRLCGVSYVYLHTQTRRAFMNFWSDTLERCFSQLFTPWKNFGGAKTAQGRCFATLRCVYAEFPLRLHLRGKTCVLFWNIVLIPYTRKSRYAPWKRGAAAELQSAAAVLQPYLATRQASCPCGEWPPEMMIWWHNPNQIV